MMKAFEHKNDDLTADDVVEWAEAHFGGSEAEEAPHRALASSPPCRSTRADIALSVCCEADAKRSIL